MPTNLSHNITVVSIDTIGRLPFRSEYPATHQAHAFNSEHEEFSYVLHTRNKAIRKAIYCARMAKEVKKKIYR
jgi:hypothetical protein